MGIFSYDNPKYQNRYMSKSFVGVVKMTDASEPIPNGKIKVMVWGVYPDETRADDLPWCVIQNPASIGGKYQTGWTSIPEVGSHVVIEFDRGDINRPIYKGCYNGIQFDAEEGKPFFGENNDKQLLNSDDNHIQDIHRYATNTNAIDYDKYIYENFKPIEDSPMDYGDGCRWGISWDKQHANTIYPYNHVFSTGRHTVEYDNTDGYERYSIASWSGSYMSIDWEGDITHVSTGTQWRMSHKALYGWSEGNTINVAKGNRQDSVEGEELKTVYGKSSFFFGKKPETYDIDIHDDLLAKNALSEGEEKYSYWEFSGNKEEKCIKDKIIEVDGNFSEKVSGEINSLTVGNRNDEVSSNMNVTVGGILNMNGALIKLNCGPESSTLLTMEGNPTGTNPIEQTDCNKKQGSISNIEENNILYEEVIDTTEQLIS